MNHLTRRQVLMAGAAAIPAGFDSRATAQTPTRPPTAPQGRAVIKGRLNGSIANGLDDNANHDSIVKNFEQNIPLAAKQRVPRPHRVPGALSYRRCARAPRTGQHSGVEL